MKRIYISFLVLIIGITNAYTLILEDNTYVRGILTEEGREFTYVIVGEKERAIPNHLIKKRFYLEGEKEALKEKDAKPSVFIAPQINTAEPNMIKYVANNSRKKNQHQSFFKFSLGVGVPYGFGGYNGGLMFDDTVEVCLGIGALGSSMGYEEFSSLSLGVRYFYENQHEVNSTGVGGFVGLYYGQLKYSYRSSIFSSPTRFDGSVLGLTAGYHAKLGLLLFDIEAGYGLASNRLNSAEGGGFLLALGLGIII
jgi:hypothetical protein